MNVETRKLERQQAYAQRARRVERNEQRRQPQPYNRRRDARGWRL